MTSLRNHQKLRPDNDGAAGADGQLGQSVPVLTRIATSPRGAEVTGALLSDEGDLFFNV